MEQQVNAEKLVKGILAGWLVSAVMTVVLIFLAALLIYLTDMGSGGIKISVFIIYILSALSGGWLAGHRIKYRKFLWGLAVGILYYLTVCMVSALSGGMSDGLTVRIPAVLICLGSGMLGGMLG